MKTLSGPLKVKVLCLKTSYQNQNPRIRIPREKVRVRSFGFTYCSRWDSKSRDRKGIEIKISTLVCSLKCCRVSCRIRKNSLNGRGEGVQAALNTLYNEHLSNLLKGLSISLINVLWDSDKCYSYHFVNENTNAQTPNKVVFEKRIEQNSRTRTARNFLLATLFFHVTKLSYVAIHLGNSPGFR